MTKLELYQGQEIFKNIFYIEDCLDNYSVRRCIFKCGYCENTFRSQLHQVIRGQASSCGCKRKEFSAITFTEKEKTYLKSAPLNGCKFIDYVSLVAKRGKRQGVFKCFCGNEFIAQVSQMKIGRRKSCGCLCNSRLVVEELNDLKGEIWKDVSGYEGYYQISNLGRVKSFKRKYPTLLKHKKSAGGYKYVQFCENNKSVTKNVHRLIAMAFIPNPDNKPEVNHKDGDRCNFSIENLEWVTRKENCGHRAFRVGKKKDTAIRVSSMRYIQTQMKFTNVDDFINYLEEKIFIK